jgi:hypothetical protein
MFDFLRGPHVQLIVSAAGLAVLVAVGYYVVAKVREGFSENRLGATDLMSSFRESYSQGELSDEEYRTIKATLAARLRQQLNPNGDGRASDEEATVEGTQQLKETGDEG